MPSMRYLLSLICAFILSTQVFAYNDLMEQAFMQSRDYQQVVNVGNTKQAVGNTIFYDSAGVACDTEGGISCNAYRKQSMLVYGIRLFLRIVIILAVPFIIFNGVYLIVSVVQGAKETIMGYTYNILIGVFIVLSSIAIIQLIQSAVVSTALAQLFSR